MTQPFTSKTLKVYLTIISLGILLGFLAGCATSTGIAGKSIVTATVTVDKAMQGWATWVVINNLPQEKQESVKNAYIKYQNTMKVVKVAYTDLALSKDRTAWDNAEKLLNNSIAILLLAINHGKITVTNGPPMPHIVITNNVLELQNN
jgi:hypothetical protein